MYQILDTLDILGLQLTFDAEVVSDWDTLSLMLRRKNKMIQLLFTNSTAFIIPTTYLDKSTFVYQFADRLQIRVAPCNVRLNNTQHVDGGLVQLDENTIVDLSQTEQLQNFTDLRCDFVDTKNKKSKRTKLLANHPNLPVGTVIGAHNLTIIVII